MSTSGSKSNEHVAHFLVDIHIKGEGITTYIKKMVELINREKIKTMFLDDVYEWIIK